MSARHISLIYFYVISAASLALIVIGIFNSVNFILNTTQYDKYPLRYRGVDCETYPYGYSKPIPAIEGTRESTPSAKDLEKQKKLCEKQLDEERKQQKLQDLKNSITYSIVGIILFAIHFPLALKRSKEPKS